jgi:hypothetical protein
MAITSKTNTIEIKYKKPIEADTETIHVAVNKLDLIYVLTYKGKNNYETLKIRKHKYGFQNKYYYRKVSNTKSKMDK